jgi:hypothetical protein
MIDLDGRTQAVIDELKRTILSRYPSTTFEVSRGLDDPRAIHLTAIADLDDPGEILDFVIDRVVDLQVDESIPLHVIPIQTPERVLAEMASRQQRHDQAAPTARTS